MSERKWSIIQVLAYFYNAFASLSDGKLDDAEIETIAKKIIEWCNKDEDDIKYVISCISNARAWLNEDINGSTDSEDLVNNTLVFCSSVIKEKMAEEHYKGVLMDLVTIGMADGNYDESEKGWVKMLADRLGIDPPIMSPIENTTDDNSDYPAITVRVFKNDDDERNDDMTKAVHSFINKWTDKTKYYCRRAGITARIPDYFIEIDESCPKWSEDELNFIINMSQDEKVIPFLKYVPDDFFTMTKQVWWLVPLVIWKEDIASWIFIDKNGFHAAHPDDHNGELIFAWDGIDYMDFDKIENNLFRLTVYNTDGDCLTFDEFVPDGLGSYLKMIDNIHNLNRPTIEASSGEASWFHGVGGEGYKPFDSPNDLTKQMNWQDDVQRPDPAFYGYVAPKTESKEQAVDNDAAQETSDENGTWNIIHDIGVFYMYFANLAEHPDGDLKDDELNFIGDTYPKWDFTIDDIKYGLQHDNPKDLQTTWDYIFGEMYGNGDPMPRVNESHKNLNNYYKNEIFTSGNVQTFLDTLYNLCMADGTLSKGQIHQLTYYCDQWEPVCGHAETIKTKIELMQNNIAGKQPADKAWDETEFDAEGKPKEKNEGKEPISDTRNTGELVAEEKLTLQGILANELTKLYPNVDVKKIDDGNYLDIHMPDVHPKRGTHLWFNTPKAGGIKVGFFCRDKDFVEEVIERNSETIETYSNGIRIIGHPTFQKSEEAVEAAGRFIKNMIK